MKKYAEKMLSANSSLYHKRVHILYPIYIFRYIYISPTTTILYMYYQSMQCCTMYEPYRNVCTARNCTVTSVYFNIISCALLRRVWVAKIAPSPVFTPRMGTLEIKNHLYRDGEGVSMRCMSRFIFFIYLLRVVNGS